MAQRKRGLLIGYSSTTEFGLFVLPGVINSDYEGEMQIMLWIPVPPCFIPAGQFSTACSIFQQTPGSEGKRGTGGFGSTAQPQIFWTSSVTRAQPALVCSRDGRKFKGLVNTDDVVMCPSPKAVTAHNKPHLDPNWAGSNQCPRQSLTSGWFLALTGTVPGLHHLLLPDHGQDGERIFWDNWEHADRFRASKKEFCVSLFLIAPEKEKLPSWDAVCAALGSIFLFDAPLLKHGKQLLLPPLPPSALSLISHVPLS